jgi:parallel beta-helix repeat protein
MLLFRILIVLVLALSLTAQTAVTVTGTDGKQYKVIISIEPPATQPPPGPVNVAPVVNAGQTQTITLPATVSLMGSATDDGLISPLAYTWSKVGGAGTVTFSSPNAAVTSASFGAAGTYTLRLTANDGALSAYDDVTITVLAQPTEPPPTGAIAVPVGADLQALVTANPEGTSFLIRTGIHRMQQVKPKNGNSFVGENGAILNGSRLLTTWTKSGIYWVVGGQTQQGPRHGVCKVGYERCSYPEDLFINDVPLRHATSLAAVKPGMWFFDYDADKIYIADDPTGKKVETSVSLFAFKSTASNVTIKNLVIEKYAQPAQNGAIFVRDGNMGTAWIIENNEVRLNHGTGIAGLGNRTIVRNNKIHDNGQMGLGGNGDDLLIEGNEIWNNLLPVVGVDDWWEGGGTKFALTNRLVLRNNWVHDNYGSGLWTDIDNINTLIEGNKVEDNPGNGITVEIGYKTIIRNNIARNNGSLGCGWLWCSQILIQNSQDVEVYGNTIDVQSDRGNAIGIINQNRGVGAYGPYDAKNNYIHDNDITHRRSPQGTSGVVADYNQSFVYGSGNNRFDRNHYHVTDVNASHWQGFGGYLNWSAARSKGWEVNGTIDTRLPAVQ